MVNMRLIHDAISKLMEEFRETPTLFFTEHDLASRCYHLLQSSINYQTVTGVDGNRFYLIHHEYPTPFRCDMANGGFEIKENTHKRGHYDLVIFNPLFLQECRYELAKGQNYEHVTQEMPKILAKIKVPAILLGLEFMLNRDKFTKGREKAWFSSIKQDYKKLNASIEWLGRSFMQDFIVIAFDRISEETENKSLYSVTDLDPKRLKFCHGKNVSL